MPDLIDPGSSFAGWLTNARLILPGDAPDILTGAIAIEDGRIAAIQQTAPAAAPGRPVIDLGGATVMPGLIDLHTDSLETHLQPRRHVQWDPVLAMMEHDARLAACGITTVADSLALGQTFSRTDPRGTLRRALEGFEAALAAGLTRVDHRLHLRLETTDPEVEAMYQTLADHPRVVLASLMDHAPGHRQSRDLDQYREVYLMGAMGMDRAQAEQAMAAAMERSRTLAPRLFATLAAAVRARGTTLASHDDETEAHVAMAVAAGVSIAEFPTTLVAARAARAAGQSILMGAPNLWRGVSSGGNVAAGDLAAAGLLDGLVSDYIPGSLLPAALRLTAAPYGWGWAEAVAIVTSVPARLVGLDDRGRLAPGLRADLVILDPDRLRPRIRVVLSAGARIH